MRARALRSHPGVSAPALEPGAAPVRSPSRTALVFLRGRDADGRLRKLVRTRATVRPRLGDWSRERIGVGARTVSEWARVWRALRELPRLRGAVLAGEVSWSVARRIVGMATPENEAACLETVRGRTVRAVEAVLETLRAAEERTEAGGCEDEEERVRIRIACSASRHEVGRRPSSSRGG
jgi:hypothetical protein